MAIEISFPCKMYKLGDSPITVSAEVDAERYKRMGWTFEPQKYVYQDLPRVLYHYVKGNKIVTTKEELEESLENGWSRSPFKESEIDSLKKQAEWHTAEAVKCRVRLKELCPDEAEEKPEDEIPAEIVASPEITEPAQIASPAAESPLHPVQKRGRKTGKKVLSKAG